MPKRIAYIGIKGLPSQAGADRVVEAIVRGVDKSAYTPTVYCSRRLVPADVTLPGINLVRMATLPGKHLHALSLFLFSTFHCLFWGKFDLVHLHNVEASFVLPLLRIRYRVLSTSHGAAQKRDKWGRVVKALIAMTEVPFIYFSNRITSVSQPLAEYYIQRYHRPVEYIPNGIDAQEDVDEEAARQLLNGLGVEPGGYVLFAAGRIIPTKGCHLLLEAYRALDTDLPLLIVGDASHTPDYERQLQELADGRVHFIPFISAKPTLLGLLRLARLFVFPSLVEAMSMMLLEAVSTQTPVLCSDIPENTSILPGQALTFESNNATDLQVKLAWAMAHSEEMNRQAQAAYTWIHEQYRWDDIVEQYEKLYNEV